MNNFTTHLQVEPKQTTYFRFDQVTKLKKMTGLPIIVRGIMNPLDAMAAAGAGASAVWVTGNFAGGASPISVMRQIVITLRGHHISTEVFMSGGIRRGTDVLKAIAFGATAVFLDPETPLWGLY